jgi:hypothetical protein
MIPEFIPSESLGSGTLQFEIETQLVRLSQNHAAYREAVSKSDEK